MNKFCKYLTCVYIFNFTYKQFDTDCKITSAVLQLPVDVQYVHFEFAWRFFKSFLFNNTND